MKYWLLGVACLLVGCSAASASEQDDSAVERGKYVFRASGGCSCHTDIATGGKPMAGGRAIETPFGTIYGSNITPDDSTGIGKWSVTDITWYLQTGFRPDGNDAQGLMRELIDEGYVHLKESDLKAIAVYLESLPPIVNRVERR